jgi:hypothetical protein
MLEAHKDRGGIRIAESSIRVTSLGRMYLPDNGDLDVATATDLVRRLAANAHSGGHREESAILADRLAGLRGDVDDLAAGVREAAARAARSWPRVAATSAASSWRTRMMRSSALLSSS